VILGLVIIIPTAMLIASLSLFSASNQLLRTTVFVFVYGAYNVSINLTFSSGNAMVNETAMRTELKNQVGSINGAGSTLAAIVRAIGPFLGGSCWSLVTWSGVSGAQFAPRAVFALMAVAEIWYYLTFC
jgi:hypothetical protein